MTYEDVCHAMGYGKTMPEVGCTGHREAEGSLCLGAQVQPGRCSRGGRELSRQPIWPSFAGPLNLLLDNDSRNMSMRRRKMRTFTNHGYCHQILFGQLASVVT